MEFIFNEVDKNILIIRADGGLNSATADQFVSELEALIDGGVNQIIVDCSGLLAVSSYGVAILLRLHKRLAQRGGDVRLAAVNSMLVRVLNLTKLDQVFSIYPDVNQARLSFRPVNGAQ